MKARLAALVGITLLLVSTTASFADVEPSMKVPKELEGTDIIEKLGTRIDPTLTFTRHDGIKVSLSEYFSRKGETAIPIIVTLGYFECPMLCSLVLNSMVESLGKLSLVMGKDYRVLSFSINPKETTDLAASKRKNYLHSLSRDAGEWDFFTSDDGEVDKLAEMVGFGYKFDRSSGEFAHGAGFFVLTPDGVLSRTFWGLTYDPFPLKLALMEAGSGKVGTVVDKILMSCFHYVPDSHKYGIYVFGVMRIGATLTVLLLGSMLGYYWISERRRRIGVV